MILSHLGAKVSFQSHMSYWRRTATGAARMADYRLYCLDGAGKITKSHEIDAKNDAEALILARQMKLPVKCELWERARLVAKLPAEAARRL